MEPVTLALLFGGVLLLGSKKKSTGRAKVTYGQKMTHAQRVAMMMEVRKMAAYTSSRFGMMPYLADYLTVVGFLESRFNPTTANPEIKRNPKNAARGLFGMRPETAFKSSDGLEGLRAKPNLLLNPIWAFCTAVNHIAQADERSLQKVGLEADWVAVRRWWGHPQLLTDYDLSNSTSVGSMDRFFNGIEDVNQEFGADINEDFAWMPVQRGGYPGIKTLLNTFGAKV